MEIRIQDNLIYLKQHNTTQVYNLFGYTTAPLNLTIESNIVSFDR